jgi:hypothetical protein
MKPTIAQMITMHDQINAKYASLAKYFGTERMSCVLMNKMLKRIINPTIAPINMAKFGNIDFTPESITRGESLGRRIYFTLCEHVHR